MAFIDFNLVIVVPVVIFFAVYMTYGLYYFFTVGDPKFDIKPIFKSKDENQPDKE